MGFFSKLFGKKEEKKEEMLSDETHPLPKKAWETASNVPQEMAANEALELYNREKRPVFLDVREEEERQTYGYIPGSVHIPMHEIQGRATELTPAVPVIVYCASGMRSMDVGAFLLEQGFADVSNLNGGMGKWTGPVQK